MGFYYKRLTGDRERDTCHVSCERDKCHLFSRRGIFTRAQVLLALLSLRKKGGLLVVYFCNGHIMNYGCGYDFIFKFLTKTMEYFIINIIFPVQLFFFGSYKY